MGRKAPRIAKAKTSKRVSTVKIGKVGKVGKPIKTLKVKKVKVDKRKKVVKVRGVKVQVSRGKGGFSKGPAAKAIARTRTTTVASTTIAGPAARNTGNVVRNTLAATRKRVSTTNIGIRDTSPLG